MEVNQRTVQAKHIQKESVLLCVFHKQNLTTKNLSQTRANSGLHGTREQRDYSVARCVLQGHGIDSP